MLLNPFQIKRVRIMTLNTIFNNISVISWRSILLVEETTDGGKNEITGAKILTVIWKVEKEPKI
jgi:hypothetical protein